MSLNNPRIGICLVVLIIFAGVMVASITLGLHSSLAVIGVFVIVTVYFRHICENKTYAHTNAACVGLAFAIMRPILWGHELISMVGMLIVFASALFLVWLAIDAIADHLS